MLFPVFGSKVDQLIEEVLLISSDTKDVRLIQTGQITVSLDHAMQKIMMFIVIFIERLFFVFIIEELKYQRIEASNMLIN